MIGIVYKIEIGEKIYIGSTIKKLNQRQTLHNYKLRQNKDKCKLYVECRKNGITEISCLLIEEKEIENELEIRLLEQEYITKLQPTLNMSSACTGLTTEDKKEYNKEYDKKRYENKKEYFKERYENNKKKIKDRISEKINCPICNSVIRRDSLIRHQRTKKCLKV